MISRISSKTTLQCNSNRYHTIIKLTERCSLTCLTLCRFIIFLVVFRIEHYILKLNKKDFQLYDFALVWRNIVPLAMLIIRLSRLSTCSISYSSCAGHRMGRWSYRGFMRWCTSDGSASGWVWPSGRWVVPALDASWLQAFYDFWHTYGDRHFTSYLTFDKSCISRPNFWLLRRGPQARVKFDCSYCKTSCIYIHKGSCQEYWHDVVWKW